MRRAIAAGVLGTMLLFSARAAVALPDYYNDGESNPLRVAAYVIYPVGYALEWLIFRPLHYVVSRPELEPVFGHRPHQEAGSPD